MFFDQKIMSDLINPVKQCLIWFNLRSLSEIVAISREILILDFSKIV